MDKFKLDLEANEILTHFVKPKALRIRKYLT